MSASEKASQPAMPGGRAYLVTGVVGALLLTATWSRVYANKAYDHFDLGNFFAYAAWADGPGSLYVDVYSDYLLLANLLFAPFRLMATRWNPFHDPLQSFGWAWVITAWALYVWTAWIIARRAAPRALRLWLAPAPLYFCLFRYEIYVVLATFAFLFSLEKGRYAASSLWLGMVIALKGYGLFLLPCYAVYLSHQVGARRACALAALAVAPFVAEHVAVLLYAGVRGVLMPYRFQGNRPNSTESIYSAIAYLFLAEAPRIPPRLAQGLQAAIALLAAGLRPRTFQEWLRASALAVLGFVLFSPVSSPQFFLWIVPMIVLVDAPHLRRMLAWLSWLSFVDYPLVQFLFGSTKLKARTVTFLSRQTNVAALVLRYLFPPIVIALNVARVRLVLALGLTFRRRHPFHGRPSPLSPT
jgi:hypothetical protein